MVHAVMLGTLVTIPALLQDELLDLLHHVSTLMYMIASYHNVYSLDYLSFSDLRQSLDLGEPCPSGSLYVVMAQVLSTIST